MNFDEFSTSGVLLPVFRPSGAQEGLRIRHRLSITADCELKSTIVSNDKFLQSPAGKVTSILHALSPLTVKGLLPLCT